jgi:hypothetical protein
VVILALELENYDGSARSGSEVHESCRLLGFMKVIWVIAAWQLVGSTSQSIKYRWTW